MAFRTKPRLARAMLGRALAAGVPAGWVAAGEIDGGDRRVRVWLEERDAPHVLAVKRTAPWWAVTDRGPAQVAAAALGAALPATAGARRSAGSGAKGPRLSDWARVPIRPLSEPGRGYRLLARPSLADPTDLASDVCDGPAAAARAGRVRVAGVRWAVEEGLAEAKGGVGPDHHAVRRRDGWYRHATLCPRAHAVPAVTRAVAAKGGAGRPADGRPAAAAGAGGAAPAAERPAERRRGRADVSLGLAALAAAAPSAGAA